MKQKRTFIAVLLVVAVLALGVAFAAELSPVSMTAKANVTATASAANFVVTLSQDSANGVLDVTEVDGIVPSATSSIADNVATITVSGFSNVGDKATFTYNVANTSADLKADLAIKTASATSDHFSIKVVETSLSQLAAKTGTTTFTVEVEMTKAITDDITTAEVLTVALEATPVV